MDEIETIVKERLPLLPNQIQEAILNSGWVEKTRLICNKYRLLLDQGFQIENSIMLTMLGVLNPHDFVSNIESAGIDKQTASEIATDINEQIFKAIRTSLTENFKKFEELDRRNLDESIQKISFAPAQDSSTKPTTSPATTTANPPAESRDEILKQIEEEDEKATAPIQSTPAQNMAQKLNTATVATTAQVEAGPKPVTTYTNDPYREPTI